MTKLKNQPKTASMAAIVIDGDWLYYAAKRLNEQVNYSVLLTNFNKHFGDKTPVHIFTSIDTQKKEQRDFIQQLTSLGYNLHISRLVRRKDRYGNVTVESKGIDVSLAVFTMALSDHFQQLILLTGDSDFVPLVQQLRAKGREVVLITVPPASRALIQETEKRYVIDLERLIRNLRLGKGIPGAKGRLPNAIPPSNMYVQKGEHFAPYLVVRKLFLSADQEVVLVDPYVDDQVLYMIALLPKSVSVTIISSRISPADFCVQVNKLRKEGYTIRIFQSKAFHDRFLGVDNQWWHSGHSFKDLGGKDSFISQIDDNPSLNKLRKSVQSEITNGSEYCI